MVLDLTRFGKRQSTLRIRKIRAAEYVVIFKGANAADSSIVKKLRL